MATFYATTWYHNLRIGNPQPLKAYYGRPETSDPRAGEIWGEVWPGEALEILAVTKGTEVDGVPVRGSKWVQFIRRNSEGVGVKLWVPYESTGYVFASGSMCNMSVKLNIPALMKPGDVGLHVCIFDSRLSTEPDGASDTAKQVYNGELLHVTEYTSDYEQPGSDGMMKVKYADAAGVPVYGWFDDKAQSPITLKATVFYPQLLKCGWNWADVPVYSEDGTIPEDPGTEEPPTDPTEQDQVDANKYRALKAVIKDLLS